MPFIRWLVLFVAVLARAAHADVASNVNYRDNHFHLYWLEGDRLFRARCPWGEVLFDHARCNHHVKSVPMAAVLADLATFGGDLPELEERLGSLATAIANVDRRILELYATPSGPDTAPLQEAADRLERDLTAIDVRIRTLDDQIARIEAALVGNDDPELRRQLRLDRDRRAVHAGERARLHTELVDARAAYIEAATTNHDSTYNYLRDESERLATQVEAVRRDIDKEVEQGVGLRLLIDRLGENGFTYRFEVYDVADDEHLLALCGQRGSGCNGRYGLDGAFGRADVADRTYSASTGGAALTLAITRNDGMRDVQCRFELSCARPLRITGPAGFSHVIDVDAFTVTPSGASNYAGALQDAIVGRPSAGTWTVTPSCPSAGTCTVVVQEEAHWQDIQ